MATWYSGTAADVAVNAGVERFASTPDAENYLRHWFEPTGRLRIPVLTLHTTRDATVPFAHEAVYAGVVASAGRSGMLLQRSFTRLGHCTFTTAEQMSALEALAEWAATGVKPAA